MNLLVAATLVILCTPFQYQTPVGVLRPFDLLVPLMFLAGLIRLPTLRRDHDWSGLLVLAPYLGWHVLSAFTLSEPNGIREGVQVAVIAMFATSLVLLRDTVSLARMGRFLLIGLFVIMVYNAGYHILTGAVSGWKTLGDAKLSMTFLPVVLGVFLLFRPGWRFGLALWLVTGTIILLSGERKALIAFGLLSALVFGRGRIVSMAVVLAVAVQGIQLFAMATSNEYLSRQIDAMFNLTGGQDTSLSTLLAGGGVESLSNAQRLFSLRVSEDLFAQHPLLGAGTNAYVNHVRAMYPTAPEYLRLGIHGEFQRITVENGLLGLGLYLMIFLVTVSRLVAVIRDVHVAARRTYVLAAFAIFLPCLLSLSFEAGATRSLVVLTILALTPDFLRQAARSQGLVVPRPVAVRRHLYRGLGPATVAGAKRRSG